MGFEVRKLSNAVGAEIVGFKVSTDLSDACIAEIRALFLKYQVLLFRDQNISHDVHIAFSRRFGVLDNHKSVPEYRHPQYPELIRVTNEGREPSKVFGRQWHSDHSMALKPAMASLLHAHVLPEVGGDTCFSNMYMAYDTLSSGLKGLVDPLEAAHSVVAARHLRGLDPETLNGKLTRNPPVVHPVVLVHPETGRKALYVNEMMTSHFAGMTVEESEPLLGYLYQHSTRDEFVYRHQWRRHDILMWDNRCTMHLALADYDHSQLRDLYRTTVEGDRAGHYLAA